MLMIEIILEMSPLLVYLKFQINDRLDYLVTFIVILMAINVHVDIKIIKLC